MKLYAIEDEYKNIPLWGIRETPESALAAYAERLGMTEAEVFAGGSCLARYDAQVSGVKAADLGLTPVYLRGWRKGGES